MPQLWHSGHQRLLGDAVGDVLVIESDDLIIFGYGGILASEQAVKRIKEELQRQGFSNNIMVLNGISGIWVLRKRKPAEVGPWPVVPIDPDPRLAGKSPA